MISLIFQPVIFHFYSIISPTQLKTLPILLLLRFSSYLLDVACAIISSSYLSLCKISLLSQMFFHIQVNHSSNFYSKKDYRISFLKSHSLFLILLPKGTVIKPENTVPNGYSSCIPAFFASSVTSSGHRDACTSPICAFLRKNMQILD